MQYFKFLLVYLFIASTLLGARYLRFDGYASSDNGQINIYEIEAYSDGVNVATGATITTNSAQSSVLLLNDGNSSSNRFMTDRNNPGQPSLESPHQITLDFGLDIEIDEVRVYLQGQWIVSYGLFFSQDGQTWIELETFGDVSNSQTKVVPAGFYDQFVSLNSGLVAYYPFNGNANDESSNSNDGVVYGASLSPDRNGAVNSSYSFDGIDDYIDLGDPDILDLGDSSYTYSLWFRTNTKSDGTYILSKYENLGANTFGMGTTAGSSLLYSFFAGDSHSDARSLDGITNINDDQWHNFVMVLDLSNYLFTIYLDGELEGVRSFPVTSSGIDNNYPMLIGKRVDKENDDGSVDGQNFYGSIDDVRIYNRVLSSTEIAALYNLESNADDSGSGGDDGDGGLEDIKESDFITYTINSEGSQYSVTDCDVSAVGALNIPSTYNNLPVTSIGYQAFASCTSITSISIPESVTSIGESAFLSCFNITNITIPGSVTTIGNYAFFGCSSLNNITIPESVESIGILFLNNTQSLTNITVASGNTAYTSVEGVLFDQAKNVLLRYPSAKADNSYIIPDSVTIIGDYAFQKCSSLSSIIIPEGVTSIGESAFSFCSSLTSVTIPDGVTLIEDFAFTYCTSLASITIPDSVTSIGAGTFQACSSLTNVAIPNSVTSINSYAFVDCSALSSITIPSSVGFIGNEVFKGCTSLTSVTSEAVSSPTIGTDTFLESGVSQIIVPAGSRQSYLEAGDGSTYGGLNVVETSESDDSGGGTVDTGSDRIPQSLVNMIEIFNTTDSGGVITGSSAVLYNSDGTYTGIDFYSENPEYSNAPYSWDPVAARATFPNPDEIDSNYYWDYQFQDFENPYVYPYRAVENINLTDSTLGPINYVGLFYDGKADIDNNGKMDLFQMRDGDPFPDQSFSLDPNDLTDLALSLWTNLTVGKVIEYKSYKSTNLDDWELLDTKLVPLDTEQDQLFIKSEVNILD